MSFVKKNSKKSYYASSKFCVVDFKKEIVGTFNSKGLCDFFHLDFKTIWRHIDSGKRYDIMYWIYSEDKAKKMIQDGLLKNKIQEQEISG